MTTCSHPWYKHPVYDQYWKHYEMTMNWHQYQVSYQNYLKSVQNYNEDLHKCCKKSKKKLVCGCNCKRPSSKNWNENCRSHEQNHQCSEGNRDAVNNQCYSNGCKKSFGKKYVPHTLMERSSSYNGNERERNFTSPEDITSPKAAITYPEEDITHPNDDIAFSEDDIAYPEEDVTYPEDDTEEDTTCTEDTAYLEEDIAYPAEDSAYSGEDIAYPEEDIAYPEEEIAYPEEDIAYPEEDIPAEENNSDDSSEYNFEMIISDEWIAMMEITEKHRSDLAKQRAQEAVETARYAELRSLETLNSNKSSIIKDSSKESKEDYERKHRENLYGHKASMIAGMEIALKSSVDRFRKVNKPKLWPVLPIRQ